MDADKVNVYQSCDRAIKAMNRACVESFGRLKLARWDDVHIIREVTKVYRQSEQQARRKYRDVAIDAYILGMLMCGVEEKEARQLARKEITLAWVDDMLERVDPVTQFRFDAETKRKAYRLAEQLEVTPEKSKAIEKALRDWSRQIGQYAINITDYAIIRAFKDADVERVMWISVEDERRCVECKRRHRKIYQIDSIPPKPHWGCRCRIVPVIE